MAPKDLYLVGLGIKFLDHLTAEAGRVLSQCRVVFHIGDGQRRLKKFNKNVIDLQKLYWTGDERPVVYERIRQRIIAEMDGGPGVVYATYGHPMLFDDIAHGLLNHCKNRRKSVHVVNGISSLDTIAADLHLEYATGLQVYNATRLVREKRVLDNRVQTILLQLGEYNFYKTTNVLDERESGRFESLTKYLRRFYTASHPVTIIYSDDGDGIRRQKISLRSLDAHRGKIFPGTSLYVPPVS